MGITRKRSFDCYHSDDRIGLGMEADAIRRHLHPEGVVSYPSTRRIDHAKPLLRLRTRLRRDRTHLAKGGTTATLARQNRPTLTIDRSTLFRDQTAFNSWPGTPLPTRSRPSLNNPASTISNPHELHEAGPDSIPGNDAGILDDSVRKPASPPKNG